MGPNGILPLEREFGDAESFAYTRDRALFVARGRTLCAVKPDGRGCVPHLELPEEGMRLATSRWAEQAYLFETAGSSSPYGLYVLHPGPTLGKLLEVPDPIEAVTEIGGRVLFASSNAIYEVDRTRHARLLMTMAPGHNVRSLATDPKRNLVFVSDLRTIRAFDLQQRALFGITDDLGGYLRGEGDALFVLQPALSLLVRLPLPAVPTPGETEPPGPPRVAWTRLGAAARSVEEGRVYEADAVYQELASQYPDWPEPHYALGLLHEHLAIEEAHTDSAKQSKAHCTRFLELAPTDGRRGEVDRRAKSMWAHYQTAYWTNYSRARGRVAVGSMSRAGGAMEARSGPTHLSASPDITSQGLAVSIKADFFGTDGAAMGLDLAVSMMEVEFERSPAGIAAINGLGFASWGRMFVPSLGLHLDLRWPRPLYLGSLPARLYVRANGSVGITGDVLMLKSAELKASRPDLTFLLIPWRVSVGPGAELHLSKNATLGVRIEYSPRAEAWLRSGIRDSNEPSGTYRMPLSRWQFHALVGFSAGAK